MEFLYFLYVVCLIILSGLVVAIVNGIRAQINLAKIINKIPGPATTPFLGNLQELCCTQEKLWLLLRKYSKEHSPIYRVWACHNPSVLLVSPEDAEVLISSSKHIEKGPIYECLHGWLGTGLLTSTGSKWQTRRKMLTPAFHFSILKQFLMVFSEQSDLLVDELETECNQPHTNIMSYISRFTLNSICETAMGIAPGKLNNIDEGYRTSIYRMGYFVVYRVIRPWLYYNLTYFFTKTFWQQRQLAKILHRVSLSVIRSRKTGMENVSTVTEAHDPSKSTKKRRLAMLDLLISEQKSGVFIDDEGIREEVDTFMFEGHDTTAECLCFTLMLLACHQDIQEKVREEISTVIESSEDKYSYENLMELKYLEMVLKESLRMYPSVPLIARLTSEDMHTYSGYTIPTNTMVVVLIYDIHHNPTYYPDPEKFDPERFLPENTKTRHPFAYIPFSAGPRNCIGQRFAMLELKMVVAKIIQRYQLSAVDTPETITLSIDLLLRTTEKIRIKLERRS